MANGSMGGPPSGMQPFQQTAPGMGGSPPGGGQPTAMPTGVNPAQMAAFQQMSQSMAGSPPGGGQPNFAAGSPAGMAASGQAPQMPQFAPGSAAGMAAAGQTPPGLANMPQMGAGGALPANFAAMQKSLAGMPQMGPGGALPANFQGMQQSLAGMPSAPPAGAQTAAAGMPTAPPAGAMSLRDQIMRALAQQGQGGDSMLGQLNPQQAQALQQAGGAATFNPQTGLPQFYGADTSRIERKSDMAEKKQQRPPTALPQLTPAQQSLADIARRHLIMQMLAAQGQQGDSMLAHINPQEARALQLMSGPDGAQGAPHPVTGLPQFFGYNPRMEGDLQSQLDSRGSLISPPDPYGPEMAEDPRLAQVTAQILARSGGALNPSIARQQAQVVLQQWDATGSPPPGFGGGGAPAGAGLIARTPPGQAFSGRNNPLLRAEQAGSTAYGGPPKIAVPPPANFPTAPGGGGAPVAAMSPVGPMGGGAAPFTQQQPGGTFLGEAAPGRNIGAMSPLPGSPTVQAPPVAAPQGMGTIGPQLAQNLDPVALQRLLGLAGGQR